jgi:hypothetical protein
MAARSRRLPPGIRLPEWSPENETLEHFERFAWTLWVPETNERLRLRDWQLEPLEDYFAGGATRVLPAPLGVADRPGQERAARRARAAPRHLLRPASPRVFVVGGENEHARNTTNAAAGFIFESRKRNGLLGAWWEPQEHAGGRLVPLWLDDQDVGIFARSAGRNVEPRAARASRARTRR